MRGVLSGHFRGACGRLVAGTPGLRCLAGSLLGWILCLAGAFAQPGAPQPGGPVQAPSFLNALNFRDLPFIPIPEVGTDPNSGTTTGLLSVFLTTDEQREIRRILAPDVIHHPDFGFGSRGRIFSYPSEDTQWYVVGGLKQRVEREFDALYTTGRLRQEAWSWSVQAVYDRSGTSRFFGIGNGARRADQTNFVTGQAFAEVRVGWNASHDWQVAYLLRPRWVDVEAGVSRELPSIQAVFPGTGRLGAGYDLLNLLSVTYDTRDSLDVPTRGVALAAYAGVSPPVGSAASYSVAGIDARHFWPVARDLIVASHAALRTMPTGVTPPFWALGSLGGDRSVLAGAQPLRGFGAGRFIDRNAVSASLELRYTMLDLDLFKTTLSVELAPFVEVGRVYHDLTGNPLASLHAVGGLGFRAVARPFIVGYVDIGYGSEGLAVFSGIKYPF
ncbi:BamA/TamA family outer membrane protein [Paeniroseomonas aquatica]|uniref:BamA/TamA family outer membrane protein n=1 Tax=Paeniroseomonas aquatica TaxID=373043 RepID=A0ABT8AEP8_9PROT|nr:BamA/TamA family outer membrane protein [Paeniroseomonas aquatica]MDN3568239.1 BamA/TamA family outer membrane protein [Paeniroseomonas aquatica]